MVLSLTFSKLFNGECGAMVFAGAPKITDRLQRVLNAAARVVSDTRKFDRGLSRIMHTELHWLDVLNESSTSSVCFVPMVSVALLTMQSEGCGFDAC